MLLCRRRRWSEAEALAHVEEACFELLEAWEAEEEQALLVVLSRKVAAEVPV